MENLSVKPFKKGMTSFFLAFYIANFLTFIYFNTSKTVEKPFFFKLRKSPIVFGSTLAIKEFQDLKTQFVIFVHIRFVSGINFEKKKRFLFLVL